MRKLTALPLALLAGLAYCPAALAQSAAPERPVFTVASVKLNTDPGPTIIGIAPRRVGDRVRWIHTPLRLIALYAYHIPAFRLSGKLLQTIDETYNIEAVAEGAPSDAQLRLMFRSLLEDRFGIKVHWETKEMTVYRLMPVKDGPKLKPAEEGSKVVVSGRTLPQGFSGVISEVDGMHLVGKGASIDQLVDGVSTALREPVLDQTGLSGTFDYDVKFQREGDLENASGNPFLEPAIRKLLGLRLERGKSPVDVLVVDRVEKLTEN